MQTAISRIIFKIFMLAFQNTQKKTKQMTQKSKQKKPFQTQKTTQPKKKITLKKVRSQIFKLLFGVVIV